MIRHILLLQPRADATPDEIEACRVALAGLVGRISGLVSFNWGENFAPAQRREGFTHGFSMDFVDRESLDRYDPHPDHRAAAKLVRATFERILVLDFAL
jgi:hypothetical protein